MAKAGIPPYLAAIGSGLSLAPKAAATATLNLVRAALVRTSAVPELTWRFHRGDRREFRHGAAVSARELGSKDTTRNSFQQLDVVKYLQIMKTRGLAAILDFLDDHDVDTTEFRQKSTAILNHGIIFSNNPNMYVENINNNPPGGQGGPDGGGQAGSTQQGGDVR